MMSESHAETQSRRAAAAIWPKARLGEICRSISDGDHLPPPKSNEGIPFITISDIDGDGCISFANCHHVPQRYYDSIDEKRKATQGDILYTVVGSFGKPVLVKENIPFCFQRHIAILRPDATKADSQFLYHQMRTQAFFAQADANAVGVAQRTISLSALRRMIVSLPPISTQRAIADKLSRYDALIENNTRRIAILENKAGQLYKEWFVRRRFPGHTAAKSEALPTGWVVERLGNLLEVNYGKDHKKLLDGDVPIFGSGGIMRYGDRALYNGEAVLIPRKGSLNNIMYFSGAFWTVDTMFYGVPQLPFIAKYLYMTLSKIDMTSFNSGAALPSMTTDILNHFKITLPAPGLLEAFDKQATRLFALKDNLQHQNALLAKERDLLLPRLMSGKLEVKS